MEFDGIVEGKNSGLEFQNIVVAKTDKTNVNIKVTLEQLEDIKINYAYHFSTVEKPYKEKMQNHLNSYSLVTDYYKEWNKLYNVLECFYIHSPIPITQMILYFENIINQIVNQSIKTIVKEICEENKLRLLTFPAAIKYHHAYLGGLAYHTFQMLKSSEQMLKIYSYLDADLVYAGILLHDIAKVFEFDNPVNTAKTIKGDMIGHLVMGSEMINEKIVKYKIIDEKAILLSHIVLSHHGQLEYGSPKKPMIAEAVLVAYIDDLDSKLTVIGENLGKTKMGEYTTNINVMDGMKIYRHK